MRKKFLLMLTLLILALGGSGKLFAANGNVAKVGNTEYATIDEAIANWTNGTTLTLLADVTLSKTIELSSTEHHILDLGTYTMTAASKKDAIQIVNNGRSSASYALDIKAAVANPGGITATGKAVVRTTGKSGVKDRPIIRFYGGVLTGTNVVYHSGSDGTNCPQFWFYGGVFNGTIYANRALFQFFGGTFNGSLQISVDSSAYALIAGGKFKQLSNLYGSALNSGKFTIGSGKGVYDRGIYVDAEGYYVVTSEVITEVSAKYPAVKKESYGSNNYFKYSAAAANGMFYEVASMAGTGSNVTIWPGNGVANELKSNEAFNYTPTLPGGVTNFEVEIKDIVIDDNNATTKVVFNVEPKDGNGDKVANPSSSITFRLPVPAAWANKFAYVDHDGTRLDDKYEVMGGNYVEVTSASFSEFAVELAPPVAKIGEIEYYTLSAAFAAVTADDQTVVVCQDVTENLTGYLRGNITTENDAKVTITLTNSDWVYCPYTFILGENITLNVPALFYYAGGSQIKGTVVAGAYYQRYAGTKLTIYEPGSMTVTSETCTIRYMDGDPNAGIYVVGDSNDETVGLKLQVAYFYQGMINAKDANIVAGTYWQTNETDGQGTANLVLDNSTLTVTVYDHPAKATGNSTVTLINGSVFDAKNGGFTYGNNTEFSVDATSSITGKNGTVKLPVAKIDDTKYLTLEDAFAAATEGQTITLLADATPTLTSQRAITSAAVIDLGGKTLNLTEDDLYFGTTTFQNGNIVVDPSVKPSTAVFWMFANQTLTFDNVKVVATGVTGTYLIGLDGNNSDLNLINGSEILVENTTALDLDIICVNASTGNDIIVENSKVNVTNLDGRVFFRGNYTVKDSEVNLAGITKAGFRIEAGQTLSIEGTSKVNIEGEPRDGGIHLTDFTATYTKAETATVNATLNRPYAAQIGENKYITFAEAAAVAQAGSEIKLLANIEGDITVPANVTLNGNGFAVSGAITAAGEITFAGVTKTGNFGVENTNTVVNIPDGASLQLTGTGRMVIGHGCTFNITGTIADAKNANVADVTPSLVMPGASFTGAGVTFNVTNAYISAPSSYCSSSKSASGTFDFNITNSIWENAGKLAFESQSTAATVNFDLVESVLNTGSHLVFGVSRGEIVVDNSNVNVGKSNQIENQSTMTIKNGSVVNGAVATSSNAKNPGTVIVENATYAVTGEFSGSNLGTGTLIIKKGATVSAGSITKANITIDATDMAAGDAINLTANLSNLAGELSVINNDDLEAKIVDGKIVLALKPEAMIGETPYETLAAAFAAAQNGDVIIINRNVTSFPVINKAVTFKGGKENAAVEINYALSQNFTAIDGTVRFENLTFNKPLFTEHGGTKPNLTIEFEGCNFNVNSEAGYGILIGTSWSNSVVKGLKVNNCNFKYVGDVFKGGYMLYVQCVNEVTITNNTIDGNNLYRGAIHLGDATEHATVAIVSNNTIKNFCRGVMMGNRKAPSSATISSNTFDNIKYSDKDEKPAQECAPIFIHGNATAEALHIVLTNNAITNCTNRMIYSDDTDLVADYVTEFTANTVNGTAVEFADSYNAPKQLPVVAKIGDKGYQSLQAAINVVQNGQTITLVSDVTEDVTLTEKVGLYYTIDGAINRANNTMNGKIVITPLSDGNDNRRITIKNINFVNTADAAVDFISCVVTNHYPRLTVEGCTFTGNGKETDVALRLKTAYDAVIMNCTGTGLHSFLQNTAGLNLTIENVKVTNSKSGLALGTVQGVTVKGCEIAVVGYGIRFDAQYNNNAVIESNKVNAFIPVVVRKAEVNSNMTFQGTNTFTATNTDGLWCAIGTSEYETNGQMPTAATGNVSVTLNDAGLNADGIYGYTISGEGTAENPYLINNINDLIVFRNNVNAGNDYSGKYVKLNADIDLNNEAWEPIGYMGKNFVGNFDGGNKTISNLKVTKELANASKNNGVGLFGRVDSPATIKNLTIENATIKGSLYVGAVVGYAYTGNSIENVTVKGNIAIDAWWYAGVIGGNGYMSLVNNCHVIGNDGSYIKGNNGSYIGGIWGFRGEGANNITNCTVTNLAVEGVDRVGGISGMAHYGNTISGCSVDDVTIAATDEEATTVGIIAGACQGTVSEPSTITYSEVVDVTVTIGGNNVDASIYGTNIDGTTPYTNYVARIGGMQYITLADAVAAANDGETIEFLPLATNKVVAMNASLYGKSVTITGTAKVDWSKGWLFVGRGGVGNATLTFNEAYLTSASDNSTYGIHVSGREKNTTNKYDGTVVINNSTIELDYLINRGTMTLDENATLTVKNGFGIAGRPASETVSGDNATATLTLNNNSKVVVNNHNGMGLGQAAYVLEGLGVMNINSGSTFECTQDFLVTANGTMNVNGGVVKIAENKKLNNNGVVNVTGASNLNIKNYSGNAINATNTTLADVQFGGAVNAFGTNNISGTSTIGGILSLGYGTNPTEQVVVNITGNFNGTNVLVYTNNGVDNILNVGKADVESTTVHFGQLGAFADVNVVNADVTYGYAFIRNDFNATNSTFEIKGGTNTYFSGNAKVVLDNTTWNLPGFANIGSYGGDYYGNADVTLKNGSSMTATNLGIEVSGEKVVKLTLEDNSSLTATNLTNQGTIVLAGEEATLTSNECGNVTTSVADMVVSYIDGKYTLVDAVAKIGDALYASLQAAIEAVKNGETITLIADVAENVTVVQAPDVKFTIDGAQKTMNGTITVDGKSEAYATAGVTIKHVKFNATGIAADACINLSDGTTATRYTNYVTVENCTFTGSNQEKAAIKSYQGGDKNLTVTGCTVYNTMHSLIQVSNITGVVVDDCIVMSKNGINLNSSSNVEIMNSTIEVSGYAVRAGVSGGTSGKIELTNNTLKTNGSEDAVVVIRGTASEQIDLTMTRNVVSGTTHISGTTAATQISADANYWDGKAAPVVVEGTPVEVNSYYSDAELKNLVTVSMTLAQFVEKVIEGNGAFDGINIKGEKVTVKLEPASGDARTRTATDINVPNRLQKYSNPEVYYAQYQRFAELTNVNISNVDFVFVPAAITVQDAWNPTGATTTTDNIYGELQLLNAGTVSFTNCSFDKMSVSPFKATALNIDKCSFEGLGAYAIKDVIAGNVTITSTEFTNCNGGFWFANAPEKVIATGNTFTGIGRRGAIQFSATGDYTETEMTITGNNVTDNAAFLWQLNNTVPFAQIEEILDTENNTYTTAYVDGSYKLVAKIGETKYYTLQAAVEAVEDGGTITLIDNEIFTKNNYYNNGGWRDGLGYSGDKSFTIDLNGKTVSQDGYLNDYLFWFQNKGSKENTITIKNGTLDAGNTAYCALCTASSHENKLTVNTEDVTLINNIYNGSTVKIRAGSEYNAKAGTKITGENSYLGIENWKATVNIYDGAEIYMNGRLSYNGCLVGVGGGGTINVYGGYGKGVKGGFIAMTSGGTINIEGGEWIANTDGTVGDNSNLYVLTAQSNKYENGFAGPSIINVTGGTFRGGMDAWVLNDIEVEKAELNIKGGNFNVNPSAFVADNYRAIDQTNGTWVVKQVYGTQTREFASEGWYWFSTYINLYANDADGLDIFKSAFKDENEKVKVKQIKGQDGYIGYNSAWGIWTNGGLMSITNSDMYMINMNDAHTLNLTGEFAEEGYEIPLYEGWNWIGYPVNEEINVTDALANLVPKPGDIIKSQNKAAYYTGTSWKVELGWSRMVPGQGYKYYRKPGNGNTSLIYSTEVKPSSKSDENREFNHWFANAAQYPSNMTVIAMLNIDGEAAADNYEVAAFANGECRGSARPFYVEEMDTYVMIMTINGEEVEELTFKCYDVNYGTEYELSNRFNYSDDAILGSIDEPYMFFMNTLGVEESTLDMINIYPNPTTRDRAINLQATCDNVEVFNALGVKVAEYQNVDTIDALETAGVYVIRVTINGEVKNCRLVVE